MDPKFFHEVSMRWFHTIESATLEARADNCRSIEVKHLLLAILLRERWLGGGEEIIKQVSPHFPVCKKKVGGKPEPSKKVERVLAHAASFGAGIVSPLAALIAMLEVKGTLRKEAKKVLAAHGITAGTARAEYRRYYLTK